MAVSGPGRQVSEGDRFVHAEAGGPRAGRPASPGVPLQPPDRTGTAGTRGPGHGGGWLGAAGVREAAAAHGSNGAPYAPGCPRAQRPQRRCRRRRQGGTPSAPGGRPGNVRQLGLFFRVEEGIVALAARRLPVVAGEARRAGVHGFRSLPGAVCGQRAAWKPRAVLGGPRRPSPPPPARRHPARAARRACPPHRFSRRPGCGGRRIRHALPRSANGREEIAASKGMSAHGPG